MPGCNKTHGNKKYREYMKIQVKNISVYDDCLSFPLGEVRKLSFTLKNLGCAHGGERREIKRHLWECQ